MHHHVRAQAPSHGLNLDLYAGAVHSPNGLNSGLLRRQRAFELDFKAHHVGAHVVLITLRFAERRSQVVQVRMIVRRRAHYALEGLYPLNQRDAQLL